MNTVTLPHATVAYDQRLQTPLPPVIALHGLGDSSIHTLMPLFANSALQGTSALFIDVPGFGESSARDSYPASIEDHVLAMAEVLSQQGVQRAPVFAHSMGANIALMLAHSYPQLVDHLILAEPLLDPAHSVLATQISRFSEKNYIERGHAMLVRALRQQAHRGDIAATAFLTTLPMADARVMYRSAVSLLAPRQPEFAEMIRDISQPVTLIVGERSGGRFIREIDGVDEIVCIADAGHSMHTRQPLATAKAIHDALNRFAD